MQAILRELGKWCYNLALAIVVAAIVKPLTETKTTWSSVLLAGFWVIVLLISGSLLTWKVAKNREERIGNV